MFNLFQFSPSQFESCFFLNQRNYGIEQIQEKFLMIKSATKNKQDVYEHQEYYILNIFVLYRFRTFFNEKKND